MRVLLFCVMLVSAGVQITAQTNTGVVTGKVTRIGGEGISGVEILFIGPLTGTAANASISIP